MEATVRARSDVPVADRGLTPDAERRYRLPDHLIRRRAVGVAHVDCSPVHPRGEGGPLYTLVDPTPETGCPVGASAVPDSGGGCGVPRGSPAYVADALARRTYVALGLAIRLLGVDGTGVVGRMSPGLTRGAYVDTPVSEAIGTNLRGGHDTSRKELASSQWARIGSPSIPTTQLPKSLPPWMIGRTSSALNT